jgi:hypothetical protein
MFAESIISCNKRPLKGPLGKSDPGPFDRPARLIAHKDDCTTVELGTEKTIWYELVR